MSRIRDNFNLFEVLYHRAVFDPEVQFDQLYNLGFSGTWDSPLYFVGFSIMEGLERYLGREQLLKLLSEQPGQAILAEYVRVYTANSDPALVKSSPTIEAEIQKVN